MFKKVTNEAGEETFVEMTEEELAEIVKNSEPYKAVKEDAVTQRMKYKELRDKYTPKEDEQPAVPQPKVTEPPTDPEKLAELVLQRFKQEMEQREAAQKQRDAELERIIKDHKLKPEAKDILALATDPVAAADRLTRLGLTFESGTGGSPSDSGNDITSVMNRVYKNLGLSS